MGWWWYWWYLVRYVTFKVVPSSERALGKCQLSCSLIKLRLSMPDLGRYLRSFHTCSIKRRWKSAGTVERQTYTRGDFWPGTAPTDLGHPVSPPPVTWVPTCSPASCSVSPAESAVPACGHLRMTPGVAVGRGSHSLWEGAGGWLSPCRMPTPLPRSPDCCRDGTLHSRASEGGNQNPGGPGLCHVLTL